MLAESHSGDFGMVIKISDEENAFEILYGGNGDLYFRPVMSRMELLKKICQIYFHINIEDGFLFDIFMNLYTKICNYDAFDTSDSSCRKKEYQLKDSYRAYPLGYDGIISWHSDDDISEIPSILNIRKLNDDNLELEFIENKSQNLLFLSYAIRFRNSGSAYDPFQWRFAELYNQLCSYCIKDKDYPSNKSFIKKGTNFC